MAFKFESKQSTTSWFWKCCIHSKVVRLITRTANKKKPIPHKLCSFTSSLCTCPASSASIECIF